MENNLDLLKELGLIEIINFISNNIYGILIVVVMLILGTIYVVYNNISIDKEFNFKESMISISSIEIPDEKKKNIEIRNNLEKTDDEKDEKCNKLTDTYDRKCKEIKDKFNCNTKYCCAWSKTKNDFTCVGGDKRGPFKGKTDEYYYRNKKYK
jgi:hypothetical protein